jgi:hypothetical protein
MSTPPEPTLDRQLTVSLTVVMRADPGPTVDEVQAALEQALVLPATITAAGSTVDVLGGVTGAALELTVAPEPEAGKYGR